MLNHEVCHLKERIDDLINDNAIKILDYFSMCLNIRKTAWKFGMSMEELYERISEWDDHSNLLESACDYDECRIEVIGRKEYDEDKIEQEDFLFLVQMKSVKLLKIIKGVIYHCTNLPTDMIYKLIICLDYLKKLG
jgi:hypothetical protein